MDRNSNGRGADQIEPKEARLFDKAGLLYTSLAHYQWASMLDKPSPCGDAYRWLV